MNNASVWCKTGDEGVRHSEELQKSQQEEYERRKANQMPFRVWLKVGASMKGTLLDSQGIFLWEHQLKLNGRWDNFYTCLKDFDNCPICEAGFKPSWIWALTIIDHTAYQSKKDGRIIQHQKKLLVVKHTVIKKLARKRDEHDKNLKFCRFSLNRDSADECGTGEDLSILERVDFKELAQYAPPGVDPKEFLAPFDYMKIFAPHPSEELRKVVGQAPAVGSKEYNTQAVSSGMEPVVGGDAGVEDYF